MIKKTMISNITEIIKEEMQKYPAKELILFGSQATGKSESGSDYDLMIIVEDTMPQEDIDMMLFNIYQKLWQTGKLIPMDLVVKKRSKFADESASFGSLAWYVKQEGIAL